VNSTKRQVQVYGSLAQYLYNVLLKSHEYNDSFDVFNALDWCLVIAIVLSVVALGLAVRMTWKLRAMMMVLTAAGRGQAASIPIRLQLTPSPGQTTDNSVIAWKYHEHVTDVLPVDISILICLLLALLVIAYRGYRKYREPAKLCTKLILELGSPGGTSSWIIAELPYGPAQYRFTVSKGTLDARFEGFCYGGILRWTGGLVVVDTALGRPVTLKHNIWISPFKANTVARIVRQEDYHALLLVTADDLSISEIIILREKPPTRLMSLQDIQKIYPSLSQLPTAPTL